MPILWRYLQWQYLKVFLLCVLAFVGILLVGRLEQIAHFASLGGTFRYVMWFTLYQIPYMLPIAIPVSCLISAMILMQRLSDSRELTALRSAGLALKQLSAPLLLTGAALSLLNFYVVSEVATASHLATRKLENVVRSVNPLILLQNPRLLKLEGIYADVIGDLRPGDSARDLLLAQVGDSDQRLGLVMVSEVRADKDTLDANGVSIITGSPADERYDHLLIENIASSHILISDYSGLMAKRGWKLSRDHLQLSRLILYTRAARELAQTLRDTGADTNAIREADRDVGKCFSEVSRRVSLGISPLVFTLLGTAFGVSIGRGRSQRNVTFAVGLTFIYLFSYFVAKNFDELFMMSTAMYLAPLLVISGTSIWRLKRITRGIES